MDGNTKEEAGVIRKELASACIGKIIFVTSNDVVRPGQAVALVFEEPPFMPHLGSRKVKFGHSKFNFAFYKNLSFCIESIRKFLNIPLP